MNAIETRGLTKSYGRHLALHEMDLRVPAGALFGFLGPNGAGKSTAIRILVGLLRASAGHALIFGQDCWHSGHRIRRQVGYLPGDVRFYEQLTGRATLDFFNSARKAGADAEICRLSRAFDLELNKRVRDYSRGMKQKLGLIQAMMHRPNLLVLDEPTTALDPLVRQTLFEELRRAAAEGRSILFSSHTLTEVGELCEYVAILRNGRLIEQNRVDVLRERAVRRIQLTFQPGVKLQISRPLELRVIGESEDRIEGTWSGPIDRLTAWIATLPLRDIMIAPPSLEDLFLTYYANPQPSSLPTEGGHPRRTDPP